MTKTNKTLLITLLSSVLILCAALAAIFATPLSSVSADTPDYLSWDRKEVAAGDVIGNKYVLFEKTTAGNGYILYDGVDAFGYISNFGEILYGPLDENGESSQTYNCYGVQWETFIPMPKVYEDTVYVVFKLEPFTCVIESTDKSFTETSVLSATWDFEERDHPTTADPIQDQGIYLLTEPVTDTETPEDGSDETTTEPEEDTLPAFSGVNFNAVYLNAGDTFDNTALFCVPEGSFGVISFTNNGQNINIKSADDIYFTGEKIEAIAYTTRYGVKAYVYNVSSIPADLTISSMAGDVTSCYMLTIKDGAEPEYPVQPEQPDDTIVPEPTDPAQGEQSDFGKFLENVSDFFEEHTGVVLGSTGAIVVLAVLLFIIFRR